MKEEKEVKVVMIGESGVGKTSIIDKFSTGSFTNGSAPTIGAACIRRKLTAHGDPITLNVWDTAGQESFHSIVPLYMRNAHGVVFVFDVTSPTGLQGLKTVFTAIEEEIKPDTQVILCANKIDLVDPELDLTDFALWAEVHRMDFMKTSAQTGEGITNLFTHMAILINENCLENRKLRMDSVVNDICVGEPTEPAQKGCC